MKRLTLTLAVLVTVISAAFATGNDNKKDSRVTLLPGENRYKLIYTGEEETVVKVRIRDENGKLLLTDKIKSEGGFMKPYNTEELEAGLYTFEVTDQFGLVERSVRISREKETKVMEVKTLSDKRYRLLVDQKQKMPLILTIYDSNYDVIHREKYKDMNGFTRVYDLSKFDSKNFTFELMDETSKRVVSVN